MIIHYDIADVKPYINWVYFYHAWQLQQPAEQQRIRMEAESFLEACSSRYQSHALFHLYDAYSDGDDVVLLVGEGSGERGEKLPFLRQQQAGSDYLCLADFIAPRNDSRNSPQRHRDTEPPLSFGEGSGEECQLGLFATSVDSKMVSDFEEDPYNRMMAQLLADRLAEATAERLHEQVRKTIWGYAKDEQLTIPEMLQERFQGIRPAVGYPSLPDASLNFLLDRLLQFSQIDITLTESGAMCPHASVSGLMISHAESHYFTVGKIGEDQLCDYAHRRDLPIETIRKFLAANL